MNPYTATREQFSDGLLNNPVPEDASSDWKSQDANLKALLKELTFHPAMAPNLQQTFMTPARFKSQVYFMWDFVGRTLGFLNNVKPSMTNMSKRDKEVWADVQGRSVMAAMQTTGKMPSMFGPPDRIPNPPSTDFGPAVLECAGKLLSK